MLEKWSPLTAIGGFIALFAVLASLTSLVGLTDPWMYLNENQILYLFSTSAQVIASIYGLTFAGFIFFRNELSREELEDDTLSDAVEGLKRRYFSLLIFITVLVMLTVLLANLAISYEWAGRGEQSTIIINTAQSAFVASLFSIAYFIFDVASPKRIESISKNLQNKLDPGHGQEKKGSLESFLRNYNEIESLLIINGQRYENAIAASYQAKAPRRISNSRLAEMLFRQKRISQPLFGKLRELITLRNSIIHGADPVVSQEIVQNSGDVLQELKLVLEGEDIGVPQY
ncbi:hypothetical protein LMG24238_01190 [Paraburkholderia sediminicola]|uniref:RiboL-PSP-HEPN domain-containing protein n=1 Tax=Paraburkholderia sediminicola TaxID=458836 RepID=A0A6J5A312_9BURK|nr:hypothetical protein [Paraburkholderia sediminicola]CAB3651876.1 hypothetical protein LMG24238_01190 [Paraburkholderia sediminicola]